MRSRVAAFCLLSILAAPRTAAAVPPVCGDVNGTSSVSAADALLVLRRGVGQPVTLDCSGFQGLVDACEEDCEFSLYICGQGTNDCYSQLSGCDFGLDSCQTTLATCQGDLADCNAVEYCGDGERNGDEECEGSGLGGQSCETLGFTGGELDCSPGCQFVTAGCTSPRFEETAAGTILDHETGLEWEGKDSLDGSPDLDNPHDADNQYVWSTKSESGPDGDLFTVFLAKLNEGFSDDGKYTLGCYAGHCDWRLPTMDELKGIAIASPLCTETPCVVDEILAPMASGSYNTMTQVAHDTAGIFGFDFSAGVGGNFLRIQSRHARAVRSGSPGALLSCPSGGYSFRGHCFYLGALGESCATVCSSRSLAYDDTATSGLIGSSGDDALCERALDLLGAPGAGLDFPAESAEAGFGCAYSDIALRARIADPPTTAEASAEYVGRACGCSPP